MPETVGAHEIVLSSTARAQDGRSVIHRAVRSGELVRVARGAYIDGGRWAGLGIEARHLARMRALAAIRPTVVFSHRSAALAWGLPLVGAPPPLPEIIADLGTDQPDRGARLHRTTSPFVVAGHDAFRLTTVERTLVDVSRRNGLTVSVPMLDDALRTARTTIGALVTEGRRGTHIGARRLSTALHLADGRCASVGESLSRVLFDGFGLSRPVLQQRFVDLEGVIGYVDFWWPRYNVIGEFDGVGKYQRDELLDGRTPAEAVVAEKRREDRLRRTATHPTVARWGWDELMAPGTLRAILTAAGIP